MARLSTKKLTLASNTSNASANNSTTTTTTTTAVANRHSSSVFALLAQSQIVQLKEAFNLIDYDGDGYIGMEDLKNIFISLGKY